jgi:Xaa-Pro dipeptidase
VTELQDKIRVALENYDAVVATGVDNFTYLSGIVLPFASNYPDRKAAVLKTSDGQEHIVCPHDWLSCAEEQGWKGGITAYDENKGMPPKAAIEALATVMSKLGLENKKIALDKSRISKLFVDILERRLLNVKSVACDDVLRELRIVKTKEEVNLLETASRHSESGIVSALNHLEGTVDVPGYTISEFSERVRVHVFEFGGSGVGHLATMEGADAQSYYAPQHGKFRTGELVRIDVTNHHRGYWSNAGRMAVIGRPSKEQVAAYKDNLDLKHAAKEALSSGTPSKAVFEEVRKTAEKKHIKFWKETAVGHGVGVSDREPPYLNPHDETVLRPGMVVALDIFTFGPRQELIHSKDTYEILEKRSRLLSWYRNWDQLYVVEGIRSTH